jgi:hypothetical protein
MSGSSVDVMDVEGCARIQSRGAPLRVVSATKSSVLELTGGRLVFEVEEWTFIYGEPEQDCISVSVNTRDVAALEATASPGSLSSISRVATSGRWVVRESEYPPIRSWRIGSNEACALAERYGARLHVGSVRFLLRAANVDGKVAPLWMVPHRRFGRTLCIRADTGSQAFTTDFEEFLFTENVPEHLAGKSGGSIY